ncbi:MAG TPA: asparagine synthase-related protein [Mycobacteriales bacterium]|nr:asparagine synthase-related protein [Mycobacteriales bacterium]
MPDLTGLLALSVGPDLDPAERRRLIARGSAALAAVTGSPVTTTDHGDTVTVITAGSPDAQGIPLVKGASGVGARGQTPPFAACTIVPDEITASTDACGIKHVHLADGRNWSAVSTSSLALSTMVGRGLDVEAVSHYAMIGAYHGNETPYTGVHKLAPGTTIRLRGGRSRITSYLPTAAPDPGSLDRRDLITSGADAVSTAVAAALDRHPGAALELSGGLDSRMILAGIPRTQRPGRDAVTLGTPGSAEWGIAEHIARTEGLHHIQLDLGELAGLALDDAALLVSTAARRRDGAGNALAFGVLDWAERRFATGPRLTGQNGEYARGFYYPGQPDWPSVRPSLVSTLGRWRIFTNDPVDPALFAADVRDLRRAWSLDRLHQAIPRHGGRWLDATDEYYLRERMRNWLGAEWSASSMDRAILAPFFHPDYLTWARSCPPGQKRGSRIFCRALAALDDRLAALPSTSGSSPACIGAPGARSALRRSATIGGKVVAKGRQRIRHEGKPAVGADALAVSIQQLWAKDPHVLDGVAALPFLDGAVVTDVAAGTRPADPATIAFLVDLSVIQQTTG